MPTEESYTILIDGRWTLEDLYVFPRAFEQVYFAVEALGVPLDQETDERISHAFQAYPWQGGYSAVNFYNQLKYATKKKQRPSIKSLKYSSPGWIELTAILGVATTVGLIVNRVAATLDRCNKTYNQIYTDAQRRKLLRLEVAQKEFELNRDQQLFVLESAKRLSEMMALPDPQQLHERTKSPLVSLKILLSVFRRVRTLAEFKERGKADFQE